MPFFVGLPVNTKDFMDRGVEPLLDYLQETARVNAVIINAHTFYGTCHYKPHEKYFTKTHLRDLRPPEIGDYDVLAAITAPAAKRGMKVYSHVLAYENTLPLSALGGKRMTDAQGFETLPNGVLENLSTVLEIDVFGRKSFKPCINHPDYRHYYSAVLEDQLRSYPIEGINFNIERFGPLENTLLGNFGSAHPIRKPTAATCFCPHCIAGAAQKGIDVERAKAGFLKLLEFSERSWQAAGKAGDLLYRSDYPLMDNRDLTPPAEGYFVEFLRILMRYPEILAYNQFWYDRLHDWFKELYGTVKAVSPDKKIGWHVWHPRDYSFLERASFDVAPMRRYADWLKPKMDPSCVGYRYHLQVRKMAQALFSDRSLDEAYDVINAILGWPKMDFEKIPQAGLGAEYVKKGTASFVANVKGEVPIYPGIGIDMPSGPAGHPGHHPTTPQDVKMAVAAAVESGAQGVVLSRVFSEMRHENLVAAGQIIQEVNS